MPGIAGFFAHRGWEPFDFQRRAWRAFADGRSGLIHAPTGMGKTLAAIGGVVGAPGGGWRVVWLTPLKALAGDTAAALAAAAPGWRVEVRTGDTSGSAKRRQRELLPEILVTTPESLHLLLTHPDTLRQAEGLRLLVVDEWHEFLSTKRGVQVELALARLRRRAPQARTWGMSATIGNLDQALATLVPTGDGVLVEAPPRKPPRMEVVLPADRQRFPWAGHLGASQVPAVVALLDGGGSSLVFTNTRSQAERWFQLISERRPDWLGSVGLHHGSLERGLRAEVERRLGTGDLRIVVATSALDLGIDLAPVDRVVQIGCPNSVARLLQRAGRSNHRPGGEPRIACVPTHALEVLELEALRTLADEGRVEPRRPLTGQLDVLCQWLVTVALGDDGFAPAEVLAEVRATHAFAALDDESFAWCLSFVATGGELLRRYPQYLRLVPDEGRWRVPSKAMAAQHRLSIGTIVGGDAVLVAFRNRTALGTVEESFFAGLAQGECFSFAGRRLEFVRLHRGVAEVRNAPSGRRAPAVAWMGTRLPWSQHLGERCRELLAQRSLPWLEPLLARQAQVSEVPAAGLTLIELCTVQGEHRAMLHPFAGRMVHDGLGALLAARLIRLMPCTVAHASTEISVGLHASLPLPTDPAVWAALLDPAGAEEELRAAAGGHALARVRFRGIARVAGLTFSGPPGDDRRRRQMRISAALLHDVFTQHDPGNRLLAQSEREAWELDLAGSSLTETLRTLAAGSLAVRVLPRLSPFAFPVWAEFVRGSSSSERWEERVRAMSVRLERDDAAMVPGR